MDSLSQIIKNLKKEEVRFFKLFMERYDRKEDTKIVSLFDHIRIDEIEDDEVLIRKLFRDGKGNANAFYRLRNRLKTELEKSLLLGHHDLDTRISLMNLINLANIFTYKSQYPISVHYLKKAEKAALQNEFYDLLELIYNELINLSHHFEEINPIEYQEKRKENAEKNELSVQADHAVAAIWYRLRRSSVLRNTEEISKQIELILKEMQIANEILKLPRVKLRIHVFIRDLILQSRDFNELEIYLIKTHKEFEEANIFTKSTHYSKINLLTWIINTLIINKKWTQAEHYTHLLLDELNRYNRLYYDRFIWTYHQSLVTTYMSSGKLQDAIALLELIKELPTQKGVSFYDYGIHVNLSLCYFFDNKLPMAVRALSRLLTKETYPRLSTDAQLSVSILECILHYESNRSDYVEYKIAEIKREFKTALKKPDFKEDANFLKILHLLVTRPNPLKDEKVLKPINRFTASSSSLQVGSSKHIDYTLWLKAKLSKTSYYANLLDWLKA